MLNAALQQAVAAVAGVAHARELHLVQCSSTGATGAIIFHGWVPGEKQARVVVKTPRDNRLQHALQREWDAVSALRADPWGDFFAVDQSLPTPKGRLAAPRGRGRR